MLPAEPVLRCCLRSPCCGVAAERRCWHLRLPAVAVAGCGARCCVCGATLLRRWLRPLVSRICGCGAAAERRLLQLRCLRLRLRRCICGWGRGADCGATCCGAAEASVETAASHVEVGAVWPAVASHAAAGVAVVHMLRLRRHMLGLRRHVLRLRRHRGFSRLGRLHARSGGSGRHCRLGRDGAGFAGYARLNCTRPATRLDLTRLAAGLYHAGCGGATPGCT